MLIILSLTLDFKALDILDQEASEDEAFRARSPVAKSKRFSQHLPSHKANLHLTSKSTRYRETLDQATESDAMVVRKMDEVEDDVYLLSLDNVSLCTQQDH